MKFHDINNNSSYDSINRTDDYVLKKLVEMNRLDWLIDKNINDLLNMYNESDTYLDIVLKGFLKDRHLVNITQIARNLNKVSLEKKAKVYLIYAKYDLEDYLPKLSEKELLDENNAGKSFLQVFIDNDKELTMKKIVNNDLLNNKSIIFILLLNGISVNNINTELMSDNLIDIYYDYYSSTFDNIITSKEFEYKLYNLRTILLSNPKNDYRIIDLLLKSYRVYYMNNKEYAERELENIIIRMEKSPVTILLDNMAQYDFNRKIIHISNLNISMLSHEFGHALFDNLSNETSSKEFANACKKVRTDKGIFERLSLFSNEYYNCNSRLKKYVENSWNKQDYIKTPTKREIEDFLNNYKNTQKEDLIKKGHNKATIEVIFDILLKKAFSAEEYLKTFERVRKQELTTAIIRSKYANILALGDIIDAIFNGNFYDEKIKKDDLNVIKACSGHGIFYYNYNASNAYSEVMANYVQLLRSKDYEKTINLLKEIVGPEFVQTIEQIYCDKILNSSMVKNR